MKTDVNLATEKKQKTDFHKISLLSFIIFSIFFALAVALIAYSIILNAKSTNLSKEVASISQELSPFSKEKGNLLLISERLNSIKKVLSNRSKIDVKMQSVLSIIPQSFTVTTINIDRGKISVGISSTSLASLDSFLEEDIPRATKDNKLGLKVIEIESFLQERTEYLLSINFLFTDAKQ